MLFFNHKYMAYWNSGRNNIYFGTSEGVSNCAPIRAVRLVQCRLMGRESFLKVLRCGRYSARDMKFNAFSQQFSNDQTLNKYVMAITLK